MDFIKNTSPKYIKVQFLAQKNAQKRARNVQEEEIETPSRFSGFGSN